MTGVKESGWLTWERARAAVLVAAAFAVRLAYSWLASGVPPWNDMAMYDSARLALLDGRPYPIAWPPLYPLFLAGITKVFGGGLSPLYAAQAAVSALTCLPVYLAGREAFGRRAALAALVVCAFYVDAVWYSSVLLAETLGLFFLAWAVYFLLRGPRPAAAGAALGLACLCKGAFLIALPPACLWLLLDGGFKAGLKRAAALGAVTLLLILPWSFRNYRTYGKFVLLEPHIGLSLFLGHNPSATGGCDYYFVGQDYASFYSDASLSPTERDERAKRAAVEFALANPRREVELFLLKLSKYWSFRTHFDLNNGPYPLRKQFYLLSLLTHLLLFPAAALGAALAFRDRRSWLFTLLIVGYTMVFTVLFSAFGRMRFPLYPFIILLGAHGAAQLPSVLAELRAGSAAARGRLAAAAGITFLLFANFAYQTATRLRDVAGRFG